MSAPTVLPTAGFTILPNYILLDPSLSIEAKATLGLLRYFDRVRGRGCFCKKETLCRFLAISPYRLRKAQAELVKLGLITVTRRGQGHPDIIRVVQRERQQGPQPLRIEVEEVDEIEIDQIDGVEEEWQEEVGHVDGVAVEEELVQVTEELDQVAEKLGQEAEELQEEELDQVIEELGQVAEERLEVAPDDEPESLSESTALDLKEVEIQTGEILTQEHYIEENEEKNINFNTLSTKPGTTEPPVKVTKKQCDELVSFFYERKENRIPEKIELQNWRPVAWKLLGEYTLDELKPAVDYAVDQGARLFFYVSLVGPGYIATLRKQREAQFQCKKVEEKGMEQEDERKLRLEEIEAHRGVYGPQTKDLLDRLSQHMRPQTFRAFFREVYISAITEESIILVAPSAIIAQWICEHCSGLLREVSGREVRIVSVG